MSELKKKENIVTYLIIFIVSIILCFNFIKFHIVPDTYNVMVQEGYNSLTFLKDGRLITSLYLYIGNILHIPVPVLAVVMGIVSLICQTCAVYIIYKVISNEKDNKMTKLLMFMGSYIIIFNPLSIEHLAYVESGIICLGKLLCVIAAKKLIISDKKLITIIALGIASICYQGILNVFITISILFMALQHEKNLKDKIKQLLWIGIACLISLFIIIATIKLANYSLGTQDTRIGKLNFSIDTWYTLRNIVNQILIFNWNLYPKGLIMICILVTLIILILKQNFKYLIKYVCIILTTILACVLPIILQSEISIAARIVSSIGSLIGISIIMLSGGVRNQ